MSDKSPSNPLSNTKTEKIGNSPAPIVIMHLLLDKDASFPLFENLVIGIDKKKFRQIICYLSGAGETQSPLEESGYSVINLGMSRKRLKHYKLSLVSRISKIIIANNVDIIHCQRHKPTVYGTLAAWYTRRKVKVVTTVHGRNRTRTLSRKLLNRILLSRVERIFAVSEAVREDILKTNARLGPSKVVTIYNGIDTQRFSNTKLIPSEAKNRLGLPQKDVFIFGTVGRLAKVKGQAILLHAYSVIQRKYPQTLLVLTGTGPLESELRKLTAELGLIKHVIFLGRRSDIPMVLPAYDVFLLPSFSEGLPLSLLEAMATGIPVISTEVGGVPEILSNGNPGIMIKPSSTVELTAAMEKLILLDDQQRAHIGKQLRDRVIAEFTKEKMVAKTAQQYLNIINESLY